MVRLVAKYGRPERSGRNSRGGSQQQILPWLGISSSQLERAIGRGVKSAMQGQQSRGRQLGNGNMASRRSDKPRQTF